MKSVTAVFAPFAPSRRVPLDTAPVPASVVADAEPYYGGSGAAGVLLCHGFTGSPRSMRAWAEHLEADGFRVALPRLPGHGTTWQELNTTTWNDWYAVVDRELRVLLAECDQVFLCGLSMGGSLSLRLAEQYGDRIAGITLVNPAVRSADLRLAVLPVLRHLVGSLAGISSDIARPDVDESGYRRTPLHALHSMTKMWSLIRADLAKVDQPMLLYRSREDHVVDPSSAAMILDRIGSTDCTEIVLERSYHVATMDYDAEEIFAGSSAFFSRLRTH